MLHFALNPTQWSSMSMRKLICNLHLEQFWMNSATVGLFCSLNRQHFEQYMGIEVFTCQP